MTEAFEIGVSLALQDGVSEAIGKARRDVAALEHAVRESGISLRSLRDVGARSASVAFGERRREAAEAPPRRVVQEMALRSAVAEPRLETSTLHSDTVADVEKGVAPRPESAASLSVEGAVAPQTEAVAASPVPQDMGAWPALGEALLAKVVPSREVAPVPRAKSVEDVAPPVRRLEASPDESVAPAPTERPKEPETSAVTLVNAPIFAAPLERLEDSKRVAAPVQVAALADNGEGDEMGRPEMAPAVAPRMVRAEVSQAKPDAAQIPGRADALAMWGAEGTQEAPLPEEQTALHDEIENGSAAPMSLLSALCLSGGSPVGTQGDDHSTAVGEAVAAPANEMLADISAPASASPATMRRPAAGGGAPGAKERDTEQASARDDGPQQGDVFLDGMLVGRWMSRFLNREASRAGAGPTGFDPRRGQLLPGVTVGG